MKIPRLLIVVGAGASKDIHPHFPTGVELAQLIDQHLITTKKRTDDSQRWKAPYISPMINQLNKLFKDNLGYETEKLDELLDDLKRPLWLYVQDHYYKESRGEPGEISIDELIANKSPEYTYEYKKEIPDIARYCIAYHIKGQEQACAERSDDVITRSWVKLLLTGLAGHDHISTALQNVTIYTFNYDRLIEFAMQRLLASATPHHGAPPTPEASVIHVYGSIGSLQDVPFECKNNDTSKMQGAYKGIRMIGEEEEEIPKIQPAEFDKVLFIGFGYNEANIKVLENAGLDRSIPRHGLAYLNKTPHMKEIEKNYAIKIKPAENICRFLENHIH